MLVIVLVLVLILSSSVLSTELIVIPVPSKWMRFTRGNLKKTLGYEQTPSFPNASVGNPRLGDFLGSRQRHSGMTTFVRGRG